MVYCIQKRTLQELYQCRFLTELVDFLVVQVHIVHIFQKQSINIYFDIRRIFIIASLLIYIQGDPF